MAEAKSQKVPFDMMELPSIHNSPPHIHNPPSHHAQTATTGIEHRDTKRPRSPPLRQTAETTLNFSSTTPMAVTNWSALAKWNPDTDEPLAFGTVEPTVPESIRGTLRDSGRTYISNPIHLLQSHKNNECNGKTSELQHITYPYSIPPQYIMPLTDSGHCTYTSVETSSPFEGGGGELTKHIRISSPVPPSPPSISYRRPFGLGSEDRLKRITRGCAGCRILKAKCDLNRSGCTRCKERRETCVYREPLPEEAVPDKSNSEALLKAISDLTTTMGPLLENMLAKLPTSPPPMPLTQPLPETVNTTLEKRKRNSDASRRFRERRKEREKQLEEGNRLPEARDPLQGVLNLPLGVIDMRLRPQLKAELLVPLKSAPTREAHLQQDSNDSVWKRTYSRVTGFKRKAVQVIINGKEHFARPDTGSDQNIMTEGFAKQHNLKIQTEASSKSIVQIGNGKFIQSIGRALVPFQVPGYNSHSGNHWFHVLAKCPVPLLIGKSLSKQLDLFGRMKHLLVNCPFNIGTLPTFKFLGASQGGITFTANGKVLDGLADTGSDLDFMSLRCAIKNGYRIDRSRSAQTHVMLADETIVETVGQVHISSVGLAQYEGFGMTFNILPGLPCDVIFGEEFVEQMDLFNVWEGVWNGGDREDGWLNTLINLGPIQSFLRKMGNGRNKGRIQEETGNGESVEAVAYRRRMAKHLESKIQSEIANEQIGEESRKKQVVLDPGKLGK